MSDEDASSRVPPCGPPAAPSKRGRGRRVLAPLALALLLAAASAGTAAYFALEMAGSSTARVAGAGSYRVAPAKVPTGAVQGEAVEYAFDVEADGADAAFEYSVAVEPGAGSTVPEGEVRCRLWRVSDGGEAEVPLDPAGGSFEDGLMRFDAAAGVRKHRYVLRAISNEPGTLALDVTVTAVQARSS